MRLARDKKDENLSLLLWLKQNLMFLIIGSLIGALIMPFLGHIYSENNCNAGAHIC
ncbi:hypothetical protein OAJ95_00970 [Pelagibacteraceae bacterium]|nr:hypothetical protein [Pelagibacteraceae bacterium]